MSGKNNSIYKRKIINFILKDRIKKIPTMKKELAEIFKFDAGAPENLK